MAYFVLISGYNKILDLAIQLVPERISPMNSQKFAICIALVSTASFSQAVILTPDSHTALPGSGDLAGTIIEDGSVDFQFSNGMSGRVQNRVTRKADNTLAFIWRVVREDFVSSSLLTMFRLGDFYTDEYDANWASDGVGTAPANFAYLFSDPVGSVNFLFTDSTSGGGGIFAQESSRFFYLDTNATEYARTATYDMTGKDGNDFLYSGSFSTFAPVPEPATMTILGLSVVALIRRRKHSA